MPSIEEQIEDKAKEQLKSLDIKYYTKTEDINKEIDTALAKYPSKKGGEGKNYPDIRLFLTTTKMRKIPVMIEIKGTKGDLAKFEKDGNIANFAKDNSPNYANIQKYALNGAVHCECNIKLHL